MFKKSVVESNACNEVLQELRTLDCYKAIVKKGETWAADDIAEAKAILKSEKEEIASQAVSYSLIISGVAVTVASLGLILKGTIDDMVWGVAILVAFIALLIVMFRRYESNKSKVVSLSKQISALDDIIVRRKGENYAKNL